MSLRRNRLVGGRGLWAAVLGGLLVSTLATFASAEVRTPQEQRVEEPAPCKPGETVPNEFIVLLHPESTPEQVQAAAEAKDAEQGVTVTHVYKYAPKGYAYTSSTPVVRSTDTSGYPKTVPSTVVCTMDEPVRKLSADVVQTPVPTWGVDRVDQRPLPLDNSYTYFQDGTGVEVYVIDTGIRAHNDLGARLNTAIGVDLNPDAQTTTDDCNGHGTHVAGTVGGTQFGVAKDVTLAPVRIFDCAGGTTSAVTIAGVNHVGARKTANPATPMVTNMSLGGGVNAALDAAVAALSGLNVPVAVAAGNDGVDACTVSPAREPVAITVGATEIDDDRATIADNSIFTSNFGTCLDLFAPGVGITSAGIAGATSTAVMSGTSMATPHVAGVAAILLESTPAATSAVVRDTIVGAATTNVVTDLGMGSPNLLLFNGVNGSADLRVTKSESSDPVDVNTPLAYTLTAFNDGPNAAEVTLTDTLPVGVTFVSAVPSQGSCGQAAGVVTCNLGSIPNAGNASVVITVTPTTAGGKTNTATVASSSVVDPVPANNTVSITTTVNGADLSVTKTDDPDPVLNGQPLTYTLTVTNNGPAGAPASTLVDQLPAGVTFVSANPPAANCTHAAGVVTCALVPLANGASSVVTIVVTPSTAGVKNNLATISTSAGVDPNAADNTANIPTTVLPAADLAVTKTDTPDPVELGDLLTYTVTVSNAGPDTATHTTIVDTLPGGTAFVSATPSQGGPCVEAAGTVTCNLGSLADGASATVTIMVRPSTIGAKTNDVTVSATEADPVSANNTASATTRVIDPRSDLCGAITNRPKC